jgi:hypothetical protein
MKFNSNFKRLLSPACKSLVFIGLVSIFGGCQWGDQIESLIQPNPDDFLVLYSDTSTVDISTTKFDSIMTGAPGRMLVGRFLDPYFGEVRATTFMQPTHQGFTLPDAAEYDSLVLLIPYYKDASRRINSYSYGDTTKLMTVSVHALKADILTKNVYYNNNTTAYDSVPLAVKSFYPRPYEGGVIRVKLPNTLGKQVFDLSKSSQLTTNDEWIAILKGLAIVPKADYNGAIIGFQTSSDSTAIQLHYHTTSIDGSTRDFVSFRNTAAYHQIIGDRSKTELIDLPDTRRLSLPSAKSGNKSFIQEGTGIMTRVDFPFLKSLKEVKYSVANRAFLRVTPLRQSVTKAFSAPSQIQVYLVDKNNQLTSQLTDLKGAAVTGVYVMDLINNTEYYSFDVSGYVTNILNSSASTYDGLLLMTAAISPNSQFPEKDTDLAEGVKRLVIGSQKNTTNKGVKLELYYTTVKAESK